MKVIRHLFKAMVLSAGFAVFGCSLTSLAAVAVVGVGSGGDVFTPAVTNISTGDKVIWVWQSVGITQHNTTNLASLWGSGSHPAPFSYTNTFNTPGSFPYECSIHVVFGMTGAVVVASVVLPPTVSITNPVSGAVFAAPANVTIQASASGNGASVTNVQFLADASVVANSTSAPYSAVANSLAAGSHVLSAIASDSNGTKATNTASISVVTPVPVAFSNPQSLPPGKFAFTFSGNTGLNYVVERSTNLVSASWIPLLTNTAASGSINFTDVNATLDDVYYRVGRLPNP